MARKTTVKAHTRYDGVRVPAHTRTLKDNFYTLAQVERNRRAAQRASDGEQFTMNYASSGGVTLRDRQGNRVAHAGGGGYDKRGTVVANLISARYGDRLGKLKRSTGSGDPNDRLPEAAYGVYYNTLKDGRRWGGLDGATGLNNVENVAQMIGVRITVLDAGKDRDVVIISDGLRDD